MLLRDHGGRIVRRYRGERSLLSLTGPARPPLTERSVDPPTTGVARVPEGQQSAHGWDAAGRRATARAGTSRCRGRSDPTVGGARVTPPKHCPPPVALGAVALGAAALAAALGAEPASAEPTPIPTPTPTTTKPVETAAAPGILGSLARGLLDTPPRIDLPLPTALPLPTVTSLPLPKVTAPPASTGESTAPPPTRTPRTRRSSPPPDAGTPVPSSTARPTPPSSAPMTVRASRADAPEHRVPVRRQAEMTAQPSPPPVPPPRPLPAQPALALAFVSAPLNTGTGGTDLTASATDAPTSVGPLRRGHAVGPLDSRATGRPVQRGPPPPRQLLITQPRPRR